MDSLPDILPALFAFIGAAYSLALVIVKLTPTPRDDAALARVSPVLRTIAKLFGLDLRQGIRQGTKPPPWAPLLACLIFPAILLTATGCHTGAPSAEEQYVAAAHSYAITVHALATAREAGQIPADQIPAITAAVHAGRDLLDEWAIALETGRPVPDIAASLRVIIAQLQAYDRDTAEPEPD